MRAVMRLAKKGNATAVSIPRHMLMHLGWLPGQEMVIELQEDMSVRVRPFSRDDLPPVGPARRLYDYVDPHAK